MILAGDCVIATLRSSGKLPPSLPKGLPASSARPTTFTVYIAAKQRRKVEAALDDPNNPLIAQGVSVYDTQLPGLSLLAGAECDLEAAPDHDECERLMDMLCPTVMWRDA